MKCNAQNFVIFNKFQQIINKEFVKIKKDVTSISLVCMVYKGYRILVTEGYGHL